MPSWPTSCAGTQPLGEDRDPQVDVTRGTEAGGGGDIGEGDGGKGCLRDGGYKGRDILENRTGGMGRKEHHSERNVGRWWEGGGNEEWDRTGKGHSKGGWDGGDEKRETGKMGRMDGRDILKRRITGDRGRDILGRGMRDGVTGMSCNTLWGQGRGKSRSWCWNGTTGMEWSHGAMWGKQVLLWG